MVARASGLTVGLAFGGTVSTISSEIAVPNAKGHKWKLRNQLVKNFLNPVEKLRRKTKRFFDNNQFFLLMSLP